MPPPLKLIVTSEHEEVLWERKFLNTDTSLGMIQAVIFYLIKCFGLWQGKDLKSLKTEHVSFDEDNLGKFVVIDVKKALGSGKVIKRYDDPDNPRSVYKILKTYKGYLANEGPFLVRPISSIKDYICYSPWPLGVNIIEQTVRNLMQECGVGPEFRNISVCLMAIDILKSFGAGSHCISTWLFRLYPRYKKTFWTDMFKKCCAINCEDKSQEACLMISHILDPPYPAATMLFEMRKRQELMKSKIETVNAQRTHVFNSWLSNINSKQDKECEHDLAQESELLSSDSHMKTKMTLKALTAAKGRGMKIRARSVKEALKKKLSQGKKSSDPNCRSVGHSNQPETQHVAVKTELMSDIDPAETKADSTDVKIVTVLSIHESTYCAQVDEAECAAIKNKIVGGSTSTGEGSRTCAACRSEHSGLRRRSLKRKMRHPKVSDKEPEPTVKQSRPLIKIEVESSSLYEGEQVESSSLYEGEQVESSSLYEGEQVSHQLNENNVLINADGDCLSLSSNVKLEPESDCEDIKEEICGSSPVLEDTNDKNIVTCGGNTLNECFQSGCTQNENDGLILPSEDGRISSETLSPSMQEEMSHSQQSCRGNSHSSDSSLGVLANQDERPQSSLALKDKHTPPEVVTPSWSSSESATSDQTEHNAGNQLNCGSESFVKVTCSNNSDEFGKVPKTKSVVGSCKVRWESKMETKCYGRVCSSGKEIPAVGSNKVEGNSEDRPCTDMDSSTSSYQGQAELRRTLVDLDNTKNLNICSSDSHLATNLVQFLDAAHKQLQNILKTSSTDSLPKCTCQDIGSDGSLSSSKLFSRKRTLGMMKVTKANKKPKLKEKNLSGPLKPGITRLSHCQQSPAISSSGEAEGSSKLEPRTKHNPCSLLRSALEENITPQAKTRQSIASRVFRSNGIKKRFVPLRLKPPLTLQTQLELDRVEKRHFGNRGSKILPRLSQKPPRSSKGPNAATLPSDQAVTSINDCPPEQHAPSEIVRPHSCFHCDCPPHTNISAETSLLKETSEDSHAKSGIYRYQSDYHENAVYQMVQIKQEGQGTRTYTISDLPIRVDGSDAQKGSLNSPRSEVCLGDYFPEGTVIPARGLKLLTRQSATGLELVLKFDFDLHDSINSIATKDDKCDLPNINSIATKDRKCDLPNINSIATKDGKCDLPNINSIATKDDKCDLPNINSIATKDRKCDLPNINSIATKDGKCDLPNINSIATKDDRCDLPNINSIATKDDKCDLPNINSIATKDDKCYLTNINSIATKDDKCDLPNINSIATKDDKCDLPNINSIATKGGKCDLSNINSIATKDGKCDLTNINSIATKYDETAEKHEQGDGP